MFIKKLDYLSPPVTFYYQGSLSHSSIVSGIISIISILLLFIQIVYYTLDIINRKGVNAFYFNTFRKDVGIYPCNASSFFHFISLGEIGADYWREGVDFTRYRILGFETYFTNYLKDKNLSKYDHWLYGICNNDTDTKGIGHLIYYQYYENSACIRKYFSSNDQKYYDTSDPKFRWPIIAHGTFHENNIFYNIIIEGCREDSIKLILGEGYDKCKKDTTKELNTAYFYFINNYIDVLNYKNPNIKFLYRIENSMYNKGYYQNNLNFNPVIIKSHYGLFLDEIKEETSYIYERNDVTTVDDDNNNIYTAYYFWLKNSVHYYERTYKRIQDVISKIGGITQFVLIVSTYINKFFNQYIVLCDTQILLSSSIHTEKKTNIKMKNKIKKELEKEKTNNIYNKNNKIENLDNKKPKIENLKNRNENNLSKSNNFFNKTEDMYHNSNFRIQKSENEYNKPIETITHHKKNPKQNFFSFIVFKLFCERKNKWFNIYYNFRTKIISEEHLIKNHLNIYNLLRATENKRRFKRNSYQLKDLIKLI